MTKHNFVTEYKSSNLIMRRCTICKLRKTTQNSNKPYYVHQKLKIYTYKKLNCDDICNAMLLDNIIEDIFK